MKLLLSTFIVCLAYSICLLGAENQIEVGALLIVAMGASIFAKKFGLMDRLGEAVNQHPLFPAVASVVGVLITMTVFHNSHFALLMLALSLIHI